MMVLSTQILDQFHQLQKLAYLFNTFNRIQSHYGVILHYVISLRVYI